jgi:enamine deaminase RidA (YjgF/YER057c/UK114 family)
MAQINHIVSLVFLATMHAVGLGLFCRAVLTHHDQEKLEYLVKKRREVFGENPPASTLIPVTVLALESLDFEIDAIAVTPK